MAGFEVATTGRFWVATGGGISIMGTGVTMDSVMAIAGNGIMIADRNLVRIIGFNLRNYRTGVFFGNSDGNIIEDVSVEGGEVALVLDTSHSNRVSRGQLSGSIELGGSNGNILEQIRLDPPRGFITLRDSDGNTVRQCELGEQGFISLSRSDSNIVQDNRLFGYRGAQKLEFSDSDNNIVRGNVFQDGGSGALLGAILFYSGRNNLIEDNVLERNRLAISISSGPNTLRNNTIRFDEASRAVLIYGSGILIEGNNITFNNEIGLDVPGNGNTIRNNDLRWNPMGNDLNCVRNTCEGNLE